MANQYKLGRHATTVRTSNGLTFIQYHDTDVVAFNSDSVWLCSGGWRTATTKMRMNQAAHVFGLGFSVFQRDYSWYVRLQDGSTIPFEEGMKISR